MKARRAGGQDKSGPARLIRLAIALGLTMVLQVLIATGARAEHGNVIVDQESRDAGSCCVEVRGYTNCTGDCANPQGYTAAGVLKSGNLYLTTCPNSSTCRSVYRTFSYPVTVWTYHEWLSGDQAHTGSFWYDLYYA